MNCTLFGTLTVLDWTEVELKNFEKKDFNRTLIMRFPGLVEIRIESNQIVIFETSVETLPDHLCKIGWSSHGP